MSVFQNLYQIFKFNSSFIMENNLNVENYTKYQAIKQGNIISIGDNQVFDQIRQYYHDTRSAKEIFDNTQELRKSLRQYKQDGKLTEAHIIGKQITNELFVKDIINIFVEKKSDYKLIGMKGFNVNGSHYVRFCCGSGQMRRNTITFINEELYKPIVDNLMCGFLSKTKTFNLAKLHAYFALSFSSVLWVRTPRVCVIKDFEKPINPEEDIDFICKNEQGKSMITTKKAGELHLNLNCADGQGMIDPEFAKLWGEDMQLPFLPCSFVVRSIFVKGNLATFDFREYAKQHNISTIRDKWGVEYPIDEIDVILSESQFKMHKYYSSWQEYLSYTKKANIKWGVARYNKKYDDENVLANYQYIQALTLSHDDIRGLIDPTVKWIKQVCSGNLLYALLYMFGPKESDCDFKTMNSCAQSVFMKAVVKNVDFLKDTYVQKKIYKNIAENINKAKLGKIWIRGNYTFMISDPVAQCQSALGLEPTGLLKAEEVYCKFWNDRGDPSRLALCRSPLIDVHEINVMNSVHNEEMEYWYQYLPSGIIYNVYDTSVFRHEDSDFDGDIVLSTDNPYFIKGANKNHNIITYEKGSVPLQTINLTNAVKTDMRGLGTGVGGFSNLATTMYAMIGTFNKDSQKDIQDELRHRIKLLREIVGQEIDRIKGTAAPIVPKEWKKFEKINPDDTDAIKAEKYRHNSMVITKKPYFFRYLYPALNQKYKSYEDAYNHMCLSMFGMKLKALMGKEKKTEDEMRVIRRYQKYSPLITSQCTMNVLCREFEDVDFDITYKRGSVSMLPTYEDECVFDQQKFVIAKKLYSRYTGLKQIKVFDGFFSYENSNVLRDEEEWFCSARSQIMDSMYIEIRKELENSEITNKELLFYAHKMSLSYKQFNWGFVWDLLNSQILEYIPTGKTFAPVKVSENSNQIGHEYLGQYYALKDVSPQPNEQIFDYENFDVSESDFDLSMSTLADAMIISEETGDDSRDPIETINTDSNDK